MFTALAAQLAAHEAGHAAAAILLGRRLMYVSRDGEQCGETFSLHAPGSDPLNAVVGLFVPLFTSPHFLASRDMGVAKGLMQDQGVNVGKAYLLAEELSKTPEFRRAFRAIEGALWHTPLLSGEECELLVALAEERKDR